MSKFRFTAQKIVQKTNLEVSMMILKNTLPLIFKYDLRWNVGRLEEYLVALHSFYELQGYGLPLSCNRISILLRPFLVDLGENSFHSWRRVCLRKDLKVHCHMLPRIYLFTLCNIFDFWPEEEISTGLDGTRERIQTKKQIIRLPQLYLL